VRIWSVAFSSTVGQMRELFCRSAAVLVRQRRETDSMGLKRTCWARAADEDGRARTEEHPHLTDGATKGHRLNTDLTDSAFCYCLLIFGLRSRHRSSKPNL
jgi:hypothetical protein